MSVPKSKQTESKMQFLETGRNLYQAVMVLVTKLPKRYTFYIGRSVYETAREGYCHVKAANAVYPTNQHEARMHPAQSGLLCHTTRDRLFQITV